MGTFGSIISCKNCSKPFKTEWGKKKFCSMYCYSEYRREHQIDPTVRVCEQCGSEYLTGSRCGSQEDLPSRSGTRRFCSRECQIQWQSRVRKFSFVIKEHFAGGKADKRSAEGFYGRDCKFVPWHRVVAEKALGRPMKKNEVVHHIDGDRLNNANSNLLICSNSYHMWLHQRMAYLYQKEHFSGV